MSVSMVAPLRATLEKFNRGKKSIAEFKAQLGKVLESFRSKSKLPLFVLVDELDRCRPPYAVTLLERVKHLFDVDDVVFCTGDGHFSIASFDQGTLRCGL